MIALHDCYFLLISIPQPRLGFAMSPAYFALFPLLLSRYYLVPWLYTMTGFLSRQETMDCLRTTSSIYSSYRFNSDFHEQKAAFERTSNTNVQRLWYSKNVLDQCELAASSGFPTPTYSPNDGVIFRFPVHTVSPHS